jgi:glycosyltransferase involved in cell wall biosynthesis
VPEDDLPAIIEGALGFVFCSTYEGFGNVPVEAMACGCPVIHPGRTSLRETVADAGLEVPPRDVAATADAIRRLAKDGSLYAELRRKGLGRAARFSWKNTALGTIECYCRALRGR